MPRQTGKRGGNVNVRWQNGHAAGIFESGLHYAALRRILVTHAARPTGKPENSMHSAIQVLHTAAAAEREPLMRPFGFKGNYLTELWQAVSRLTSSNGHSATGLATQSVLYGDADFFAAHPEQTGNEKMFALTKEALSLLLHIPFTAPPDLLEALLPQVKAAAGKITGKPDIHINFILNSLVSVDNAAWLLYARENGLQDFDTMIPAEYKNALAHRNRQIAVMFQVSYNMPVEDVVNAVKTGYFVIKIKTGYPGTQEEMLAFDSARLAEIHEAVKDLQTPHGPVRYTMDANGRYERKETLLRYLDHARRIGAFDRILLYEEPFCESFMEPVHDVGLRLAVDESVHSEADALLRLEQGYTALVLKGVAKTLSLSMRIAALAAERGVPCLCSDLTVNPVLVDWHKNLAARLSPFPGIGMGMMETNGDMNYTRWNAMKQYHPAAGSRWTEAEQGVFSLGDDFYAQSGGILAPSPHYEALLKQL